MTNDQRSLDVTRATLIEAAGQVFAEFGFQRATMREICLRAGTDMAALNYYFGDKLGSTPRNRAALAAGVKPLQRPWQSPQR